MSIIPSPIPLLEDMNLNDNAIKHIKRQVGQPYTSVVHVTITAAGTVVYTHTATSYSFIPSYSTIQPTSSTTNYNGTNSGLSNPNEGSTPNLGAIIGGVIGGVAFISLIDNKKKGLIFLFMRRSKKKKTVLPPPGGYIDDTDSYYQRTGGIGMTSPAPRQLVAPLSGLDGESKYYHHDGGYYDVSPAMYPNPTYYSTTNSVTSDSLPSTTVDASFRQVPNLVNEERHVPHLKDHIVEPPHTKD